MFRLIKKLLIWVFLLLGVGVFGYYVVLPQVLPLKYREQVEKYAKMYDVEESLIFAVIFCESRFDPDAHSRAGAKGLMQVTTETGWWAASRIDYLDVETIDLKDPETSIAVGTWYLQWLEDKFEEVEPTVLAAYNAGHGKVSQWLADEKYSDDGYHLKEIPFAETNSYVKKVEFMQKLYKICYRL
ncbi:MAG: lytic transglycosylase domain-containing protein [Anaerotignum propionicum]|jgi:soluble lytic murein transglycosylase|uniref:lytic transglycosylase domain-containing protein n=1 Tax=Anaerotignum propionicum TaxID=28446 RepID=UPI002B20F5D0|nr:lytic transglycosylase domain-containing protein [Anaerotignum propionicum]MEA5057121.1 lytic transglycosylase domain-containing protein [Anaerotignum propionicum]